MTSLQKSGGRVRNSKAFSSRGERGGTSQHLSEGIYANKPFIHAFSTLVGLPVDVQVVNGNIYSGILKTISPKSEICLEAVHLKQSLDGSKEEDVDPSCLLPVVFGASDILVITASKVNPSAVAKVMDSFRTDTEISKCNGVAQDKEFEPWRADDADSGLMSELEGTDQRDHWDPKEMFEVNKKKFNVKSSFNETMEEYTTPLQHENTDEFRKRKERADKVAKDIEGNKKVPVDDVGTEEERFSSVPRPSNDKRQSLEVTSETAQCEPSLSTATEVPSSSTSSAAAPVPASSVVKSSRASGREGCTTMPSIPENCAVKSQSRKKQTIEDLKSFKENFQLKVKEEMTGGSQEDLHFSSQENAKSSQFSLNPDAKEFCPFPPQPSLQPSHQAGMLPTPATPTSPSVSPEPQIFVPQHQHPQAALLAPVSYSQPMYMTGPTYMQMQQMQQMHPQQQPQHISLQQLPMAAAPVPGPPASFLPHGQPLGNRGHIMVNHPSSWPSQMIPVQQMIPQHPMQMMATQPMMAGQMMTSQPMMAPQSPQMGPQIAVVGSPAEGFVPGPPQAVLAGPGPLQQYGHPRFVPKHHQPQQQPYASYTQLSQFHPVQQQPTAMIQGQPVPHALQGNNNAAAQYQRHGPSPPVMVVPSMYGARTLGQ